MRIILYLGQAGKTAISSSEHLLSKLLARSPGTGIITNLLSKPCSLSSSGSMGNRRCELRTSIGRLARCRFPQICPRPPSPRNHHPSRYPRFASHCADVAKDLIGSSNRPELTHKMVVSTLIEAPCSNHNGTLCWNHRPVNWDLSCGTLKTS